MTPLWTALNKFDQSATAASYAKDNEYDMGSGKQQTARNDPAGCEYDMGSGRAETNQNNPAGYEYDMGPGRADTARNDPKGYDYGIGSGDSQRMEQEIDHGANEFGMGSGRPSDQNHASGRQGSFVGKLKGRVEHIFHSEKEHEKGEK